VLIATKREACLSKNQVEPHDSQHSDSWQNYAAATFNMPPVAEWLAGSEKPRMNWTKLSGVATAMAAALIAAPSTAYADPVPSTDEVVAVLAELTDPNIPAANKANIVSPGFSPEEAGTIDDHLNQMRDNLPLPFVVTDIEPAPNHFAGATLATTGSFHQISAPKPIVLVNQHGHWLITHDTAMTALDAFWYNENRPEGHRHYGFAV
jgi:hypothetical protein